MAKDRAEMKLHQMLPVLLATQFLLSPSAAYASAGGADPTDQFLAGEFLNVGINQYGALGSSGFAPVGFHTRSSSASPWSTDGSDRLGITYDRGLDGWGVGRDIGDLFLAGTPFEGFALSVGTDYAWNTGNGTWDLGPGTFTESDASSATWVQSTPFMGVQLTQRFEVSPTSNQLYITITLKNVSDANITDLYYTRCVDPDTIEPEAEGVLATSNAVIGTFGVEGYAAAWAQSPDETLPADLGLWSYAPTARAHIDCSNPVDDYAGPGTGQTEYIDADTNIGITVYNELLAPGDEIEFTIGYGMSLTAIAPPPPPDLPETQKEMSLLIVTVQSLLMIMVAAFAYWLAERALEPELDGRDAD